MGETNASRLRRETPTLREAAPRLRVVPLDGSCFMPGNPFGLRHLLYAGEPVHRSGLPSTALPPLCRETLSAVTPLGETPRPYCLTTAVAYRPQRWLPKTALSSKSKIQNSLAG